MKASRAVFANVVSALLLAVGLAGCQWTKPLERGRGALLLSFDDRGFRGWEEARPIFRRYGAHATFFVNGRLDRSAAGTLFNLIDDGHSVGLHGFRHLDADLAVRRMGAEKYYQDEIVPQLLEAQKWGIPISSFAYPNCRRDADTDALFFSKGFAYVRASAGVTPYDPKGVKQKRRILPPTAPQAFLPVAEVGRGEGRVIRTLLVGRHYQTHWNEIMECLQRAAALNEIVSITSHDIAREPSGIGITLLELDKILAEAQRLGLPVIGYDELPRE